MKDELKKSAKQAFVDIFIPVLFVTWAVGLGMFSLFLMLSAAWDIFSFF